MDDLISLAVIAVVIALLMGYVRACHRMIGEPADSVPPPSTDDVDTAAPAPPGRAR